MYSYKYTHSFKAITTSSMRVKIGAEVINEYTSFDKYKNPKMSSLKNKNKRIMQLEKINSYCTKIVTDYDFGK